MNVTLRGDGVNLVLHSSVANSCASIFTSGTWPSGVNDGMHTGFLWWDFKGSTFPNSGINADPLFSTTNNAAEYRIIAESPAFTCGDVPTDANYGTNYWKYAGGDVNGNRLVFTDGKPLAGAFHGPFDGDGVTDWYLDLDLGDDANYGDTKGSAKASLDSVLALGIRAGATVHFAAGTYGTGSSTTDKSPSCPSRIVVPEGMTFEGAGADVTVIEGSAPTAEPGYNNIGPGSGAIRCVYLNKNATLRGFTLCGGRTYAVDSSSTTSHNNQGGGVLGWQEGSDKYNDAYPATVEDCVITNCAAVRAGGAAYVTLRRCRVFNCHGSNTSSSGGNTGNSSGAFRCRLFSTVVDNCGYEAVTWPKTVENCTLGSGNGGDFAFWADGGDSECRMANSVFLSKVAILQKSASEVGYSTPATNCLFASANCDGWTSSRPYNDYLGTGSRVVIDESQRVFDANYAPVIGQNVAVDAGDKSIVTHEGDEDGECECRDVYGNQRIYNNQIDIGAVEANWCPNYTSGICMKPVISVTEASPGVEEVTNGTARIVSLNTGSSIEMVFSNTRSRIGVNVISLTLRGNSSVTLSVDGVETVFTTPGVHLYKVKIPKAQGGDPATQTVRVACTEGSAELKCVNMLFGLATAFK